MDENELDESIIGRHVIEQMIMTGEQRCQDEEVYTTQISAFQSA